MPIWEIEAVVPPGDPRWLGRRAWRSILVRARSPAAARLVAARLEPRRATGNESDPAPASFEDEKLYWVRQVTDLHDEEDGPDTVLAASPFPRH